MTVTQFRNPFPSPREVRMTPYHTVLSSVPAPTKIWQSNIFGKSLYELVNEGLHNKLSRMPETARMKLKETLQRIINDEVTA